MYNKFISPRGEALVRGICQRIYFFDEGDKHISPRGEALVRGICQRIYFFDEGDK